MHNRLIQAIYCLIALLLMCINPLLINAQSPSSKSSFKIKSEAQFDSIYAIYGEPDIFLKKTSEERIAFSTIADDCIDWAINTNNNTFIFRAKFLKLNWLSDDLEIIKHGEEMMSSRNFESFPESTFVVYWVLLAYENMEAFVEVIELLPRYFKLGEKWQSSKFKSENLDIRMGKIFFKMGDFVSAKKHFIQNTIAYADYPGRKASSYNNIGLCYYELNKPDLAIRYFDSSLNLLDSILQKKIIVDGLTSRWANFKYTVIVNKLYALEPKVKNEQLKEALLDELYAAKQEQDKNIIASSYANLAQLAYDQNQYENSVTNCDSAISCMASHPNSKRFLRCLNIKARALARIGKWQDSEQMFKQYDKLKDSLDRIKLKEQSVLAVAKYNVNEKNQELIIEKLKVEEKEKSKDTLLLLVFIISILLVIALISAFKIYNTRKKVEHQMDVINGMLEEKELLLKEIHHRVKNNLQAVSGILQIQASKANDTTFNALVKESGQSINAIAMVHQMLYQNESTSSVDMKKYIRLLCQQNLDVFQDHRLSLSLDIQTVLLKIEQAIPLGLIINELLTNTYKHAYIDKKGEIAIKLTTKNNFCTLIFRDFGKGLQNSDKSNHQSIGNMLIAMLADELESTLTKKSDGGLTYQFEFTRTA